jgi:demethylmenaquinone methyltransferase/2-methoxy-6-polyprenyl-1,4-benzoquinol methylase
MKYATVKADVRTMFNSIAGRYDLINSALSFGIDKIWRKQLLSMVKGQRFGTALDVATGTGAFLPALSKIAESVRGVDLSPEMLRGATKLIAEQGLRNVKVCEEDALSLSDSSGAIDLITVAFGVRNFESLSAGLREMLRVLKPGGQLLVLEFGRPENFLMRALYKVYSENLVPFVGGLISGDKEAYRYLNRTSMSFPCGHDFVKIAEAEGFECLEVRPLFTGIAWGYQFKRRG